MNKQCNICLEIKPMEQFYKQSKAPDGYQNRCKQCANDARQVWALGRRDEIVERAQKFQQDNPDYLKTCSRCREEKPWDAFANSVATLDGKNAYCSECARAYIKQNYRDNIEERREYNRKYAAEHGKDYYAANKDKEQARLRQWQEENPERFEQSKREWHQNNPAKVKAKKHRRRALENNLDESFTPQEWEDLCIRYEFRCLRCKKQQGELDDKQRSIKLTADHVIPLFKEGHGTIDNIQPLCGPCNSSKGIKEDDYR